MTEARTGTVVVGLFASPQALLAAVARLRGQSLGRLEAYTPHPVHGLAQALGLKPPPLGVLVLMMGCLGALAALGFQYWVSAVDYPLVTGGKAPTSWEAFVPVAFEATILGAAFTAGLGMLLWLNRLPGFGHPLLAARAMRAITRDRYGLALEGQGLDVPAALAALRAAGAQELEVLADPQPGPPLSSAWLLKVLGTGLGACLLAGGGCYGLVQVWPGLAPISHLLRQPRVKPQAPSPLFADGRAMRVPVAGTVARGHLPLGVQSEAEAALLVNPLPVTAAVLERGRRCFQVRCALCHGPLGHGQGSLGPAYGAQPADLHTEAIRAYPDGRLYWTLVMGKDAMPGQGKELDHDQRWAVVHYLRALQRAQQARPEDLP